MAVPDNMKEFSTITPAVWCPWEFSTSNSRDEDVGCNDDAYCAPHHHCNQSELCTTRAPLESLKIEGDPCMTNFGNWEDEADSWKEDEWSEEDDWRIAACSQWQSEQMICEGSLHMNCQQDNENLWRDGSTTNDSENGTEADWSEDDEAQDFPGDEFIGGGAYWKDRWIGGGGFADVYLAYGTETGWSYAAKIGHEGSLRWEADVMRRLHGLSGFPEVHHYAVEGQEGVLVMDHLGKNLDELRTICGGQFSLKTVLYIADQVLQRLEDLHAAGIIHRDIKPDNFVIGSGSEANTIHIIDFGLANEFRDKATRRRSPYVKHENFSGTPAYASRRAHKAEEQSWRDDLESTGYMLVSLLQGVLPWERDGKSSSSGQEWLEHCAKRKGILPPELICSGCPKEFSEYLKYCRQLKFDEKPDYAKRRGIFRSLMERECLIDDGTFDWSHLDFTTLSC